MNLKTTVEAEIKKSMLNKEKEKLQALRAIKAQILLMETEKGGKEELSSQAEISLLTKAAKQRKDCIAIFETEGRQDLAEIEKYELSIIQSFLPKQLTEEEIEKEVVAIIASTGSVGKKDLGKVMGVASKKMAGIADGKIISEFAKKYLV